MQRAIILALLAARAFGTKCDAGYKHKADLASLHCSTSKADAASCSSTCCDVDKKKCGGLSITCPSDKYHESTDAWKNTAATEKTKLTACCTEKATCGSSSYMCAVGKKKKFTVFTNAQEKAWYATKCPGGAKSCSEVCCVDDDTKCGGNSDVKNTDNCPNAVAADGTHYYKIWTSTDADDAWKNTKITGDKAQQADRKASCCGVRPTCSSTLFSCPAGQRKKTANKDCECVGGPGTCSTVAATTCGATASCCEPDTTTCGGNTVSCANANQYNPGAAAPAGVNSDSWKNRKISGDVNVNCCTTQATCKDAVCKAGYKKKANVDKNFCPTNRDSCAEASGGCCEKDNTKCGGVTQVIQCAYGFYDESTTWIFNNKDPSKNTPKATMDAWKNKNTTEGTRNTECCTPKAICEYEAPATTTPGPVATAATTTPVYVGTVRRYSEHMAAVQKGSDQPRGASMVWLGVGGLIGMGFLMAVQGLRSRMPAPSASLE